MTKVRSTYITPISRICQYMSVLNMHFDKGSDIELIINLAKRLGAKVSLKSDDVIYDTKFVEKVEARESSPEYVELNDKLKEALFGDV